MEAALPATRDILSRPIGGDAPSDGGGALEDLPEGGLEAPEPEPEAEGRGLRGEGFLPFEDERRHFSHRSAEREGGGGGEGGPAENFAERRGELLHRDGRGGRGIERPLEPGVLDGCEEERDEVVAVDPRHPLAPASERSAQAEAEGGEHLRECAALLAEDDPDAGEDEADSLRCRPASCLLPGDSRRGKEPRSRTARLGQLLVPTVAVEADGRGVDEDGRPALRPPER